MSKCVSVPIVAGVCETEERVFEAAFLGREPCEFDSEANTEPEDLDGLESVDRGVSARSVGTDRDALGPQVIEQRGEVRPLHLHPA